MTKNILVGLMMLASTVVISSSALADEPTLQQVYQAAEAGRLSDAQTMMREVLNAHPNSGKAHFVEAELLVKQGQLQKAEAELATAERLAPGLPFEKPQAVHDLKRLLGTSRSAPTVEMSRIQTEAPDLAQSIPWGLLLTGIGLIAFIAFAARFMAQRNAMPVSRGGTPTGYSPGTASPPSATPMQPYAAGSMSVAGAQPGLGSSVMSGLATGAAVGAGMVAGEALLHHFMDGNGRSSQPLFPNNLGPSLPDSSFDDMGGSDFGVSDASSWDDASGGGSDWN